MSDSLEIHKMQNDLLSVISNYSPVRGSSTTISNELVEAYFKTPRHNFIDRFKLVNQLPAEPTYELSRPEAMKLVYSNQPLMYIGGNDEVLPASNSEPAFICHLLALLDIKAGHRVLEIGCGTGWLSAIMGRLVGSGGSVIGVEIIEHLAMQARDNINRLNIENVDVILGDGAELSDSLGQFDRIIFTASTYAIPEFAMTHTCIGGRICIPLQNRGLAEEVFILDRTYDGFDSVTARLCKFVPMTGSSSGEIAGLTAMPQSPEWNKFLNRLASKERFELVADSFNQYSAVLPLSSFMAKCSQSFRSFYLSLSINGIDIQQSIFGTRDGFAFGIVLPDLSSGAFWFHGDLFSFGEQETAADEFRQLFTQWKVGGFPYGSDFLLSVRAGDANGPANAWVQNRNGLKYYWRLPSKLL